MGACGDSGSCVDTQSSVANCGAGRWIGSATRAARVLGVGIFGARGDEGQSAAVPTDLLDMNGRTTQRRARGARERWAWRGRRECVRRSLVCDDGPYAHGAATARTRGGVHVRGSSEKHCAGHIGSRCVEQSTGDALEMLGGEDVRRGGSVGPGDDEGECGGGAYGPLGATRRGSNRGGSAIRCDEARAQADRAVSGGLGTGCSSLRSCAPRPCQRGIRWAS